MIKLTSEELRYMSLFELVTGVPARDCVIDDVSRNLVTFIVEKGRVGEAVGKGGANIRRLRAMIGKEVEVVAFSNDPEEIVKNALAPASVQAVKFVEKNGKKIAVVFIDFENRGKAIGRKGGRLRNAKKIAKRHCGVDDIVFGSESYSEMR